MDQLKLVEFQNKLIDQEIDPGAEWLPDSRVKPIQGLRMLPQLFTAWQQIRNHHLDLEGNPFFEVYYPWLEQSDKAVDFFYTFEKAAHSKDIPTLPIIENPMTPGIENKQLKFYVDCKVGPIRNHQAEALARLAEAVSETNSIRTHVAPTLTGITVSVFESCLVPPPPLPPRRRRLSYT